MNVLVEQVAESLKQRNDAAKFFRRNACARHGVVWPEEEGSQTVTIEHRHSHEHKQLPVNRVDSGSAVDAGPPVTPKPEEPVVIDDVEEPPPTPPSPVNTSIPIRNSGGSSNSGGSNDGSSDSLLKKVGVPLAVGAATLGGVGAGALLARRPPPDPPETTGSLLQELEDQGRHIPKDKQ